MTVSVIAVNHNGAEVIEAFLASLEASEHPLAEVIVVDCASTDDSLERIRRGAWAATVVEAPNLGFGRGCNLGAERARGELLLFANPDVVLHPDTVSTLVRDLKSTPGAAVVCPTLLEPSHPTHVREARVEEVASMAFAVALVDRAHFQAIGGFDPAIFLYWEDTDFCYRTWLAGRKVLKAWDAVAEHELGGSAGGSSFAGEQIKNGLRVHVKLRSWPATARFAGRMAVKTVVHGVGARDPAVLRAWVEAARGLRRSLAARRRELGRATAADRARLWELCRAHDYWQRRAVRARIAARGRAAWTSVRPGSARL